MFLDLFFLWFLDFYSYFSLFLLSFLYFVTIFYFSYSFQISFSYYSLFFNLFSRFHFFPLRFFKVNNFLFSLWFLGVAYFISSSILSLVLRLVLSGVRASLRLRISTFVCPSAANVHFFWHNLRTGTQNITPGAHRHVHSTGEGAHNSHHQQHVCFRWCTCRLVLCTCSGAHTQTRSLRTSCVVVCFAAFTNSSKNSIMYSTSGELRSLVGLEKIWLWH